MKLQDLLEAESGVFVIIIRSEHHEGDAYVTNTKSGGGGPLHVASMFDEADARKLMTKLQKTNGKNTYKLGKISVKTAS